MDALTTMTGWAGSDVDHRIHPNLTTAKFRLACTPRIYRQGAWSDDPTTWITVTCFRALADHVSLSVKKGDPVVVSGKLRTQVWQGKDDNQEHERLVLEASVVGHDLSRGTATFAKSQRPAADPTSLPTDTNGMLSPEDGPEDGPSEDEEHTPTEVAA